MLLERSTADQEKMLPQPHAAIKRKPEQEQELQPKLHKRSFDPHSPINYSNRKQAKMYSNPNTQQILVQIRPSISVATTPPTTFPSPKPTTTTAFAPDLQCQTMALLFVQQKSQKPQQQQQPKPHQWHPRLRTTANAEEQRCKDTPHIGEAPQQQQKQQQQQQQRIENHLHLQLQQRLK
ncbi:GL26760 [Drosophila persimilis]|uniref:GL26760 n=1 Tax=Drosophila persimilis TaxID=7234 RepID=B4H2N1_DROPE|nr:GL26760 [Drosophila persimilis]